jgi:hypothetical protein
MQALTRGRDERPRRLDLTPVNDNAGLGAVAGLAGLTVADSWPT